MKIPKLVAGMMLVFPNLCCRHERPAPAPKTAQEPQAVVSYPSQPEAPTAKLRFHEDLRIQRCPLGRRFQAERKKEILISLM